jgi:hypothetical protein
MLVKERNHMSLKGGVEIWCPYQSWASTCDWTQLGPFGLSRVCWSLRPIWLCRGDHFMQNDMVEAGIHVFFAPKAICRHLVGQHRRCHIGWHRFWAETFELKLVWNQRSSFYFKPEQPSWKTRQRLRSTSVLDVFLHPAVEKWKHMRCFHDNFV